MEFLRGLLGFLGMAAAFMTGRSAVAVRKGWQKPSRLYGWVIRTAVCVVAVAFRNPVDTVDLIVWGLAAMALAAPSSASVATVSAIRCFIVAINCR